MAARVARFLVLVILMLPSFMLAADPVTRPTSKPTTELDAFTSGGDLTARQVGDLEQKLLVDPDDVLAHVSLLGYYELHMYPSTEAKQAWEHHLLWMIEHHAASAILREPGVHLSQVLNPEAYPKAALLWQQQVKANPNSAAVLANMARFVSLDDPMAAAGYLQQAKAAEPQNPEWCWRLGALYSSQVDSTTGEDRKKLAALSLAEGEQALELNRQEWALEFTKGDWSLEKNKAERERVMARIRFQGIRPLGMAAFEANEFTKAEQYAKEVLRLADREKSGLRKDSAIRTSHIVLGRLALRSDRIEIAKQHLLEAAQRPERPDIDTVVAPDMTLAKELLEKGQPDVVIEYLKRCGEFWKNDNGRLEEWIQTIQDGKIPEFERSRRSRRHGPSPQPSPGVPGEGEGGK